MQIPRCLLYPGCYPLQTPHIDYCNHCFRASRFQTTLHPLQYPLHPHCSSIPVRLRNSTVRI
ncbi:hypothetical protein BDV96DRAFT_591576 [Lophiotrema nucula]|uniref:Uncharacterized protein n=1 Tax=Lophiotrema nucula TaxID=690887 RepID=A0A6A5YFJ6_9PLEO|nr:hypothetical protein BDV96DRAFT_591576 [Lophiotrema nucula]